MPHGTAKFTKFDVARAVAGVRAAGCEVIRVEIARDDGRIIVNSEATETPPPLSDYDKWKAAENGAS